MKITINGESQIFQNSISILEAMKILHIEQKVVAIALNSDIIKKEQWDSVILKENDELEALHFVSGG